MPLCKCLNSREDLIRFGEMWVWSGVGSEVPPAPQAIDSFGNLHGEKHLFGVSEAVFVQARALRWVVRGNNLGHIGCL